MNFLFQNTTFDPIITSTPHVEDATVLSWLVPLFILFFILSSIAALKFESNNTKIGWSFMAVGVIALTMSLILTINIQRINDANEPNNKNNVQATQSWVEATYLVKLNKDQTNALIDNRVTNNDLTSNDSVRAKYYGENVFIQLVQVDDDWVLFMNDKEMLRTDK